MAPQTPSNPVVVPTTDETRPLESVDPERTRAHTTTQPAGDSHAVPGYAILDELGKGGMGVVYKARHLKLNRIVALKTMLGDRGSGSDLYRFLAEAGAVAAIRHEYVVQVFDYGEVDGRPFMALEYCAGGTLARVLPKSADSVVVADMSLLLAKVARGVAAAHERGIVHRDLKPGNILLTEGGVPKVADFGLAKLEAGEDVTQAGIGMGTPAYMSPEQASDAKFVGPQTDVWALGVILYEALTGRRPFTGSVKEMMAQAQNAEPAAPRRILATLPLDLELICLKCLSKAPGERYPTARELADDLDRFNRGEAISVRPLATSERIVRWVRRKPTLAAAWGLSGLAALLAAVVLIVFGLYRDADTAKGKLTEANGKLAGEQERTESARAEAVKQRGIAEERRIAADKSKEEALVLKGNAEKAELRETKLRKLVEVSDYGHTSQIALQSWRDKDFTNARTLLDGTKAELRGWEWHYLNHLFNNGFLRKLEGSGGAPLGGRLSADGTRFVAGAEVSKTAIVWSTETGAKQLTLIGHDHWVNSAPSARTALGSQRAAWTRPRKFGMRRTQPFCSR